MKRVLSIAAAVPLVALAVAGCGSSDKKSANETTTPTTATAAQNAAPAAKVEFVTPKDGGSSGSTVTAKVKLTGFELAPKEVGKAPSPGQGHLHFAMDEGKFDKPKYSGANGELAVKLGVDGKYSPSVAPTITYKGLPKGKHVLQVFLANNDHSEAGVDAKTEFTVK